VNGFKNSDKLSTSASATRNIGHWYGLEVAQRDMGGIAVCHHIGTAQGAEISQG
jgi:hypothetical protein